MEESKQASDYNYNRKSTWTSFNSKLIFCTVYDNVAKYCCFIFNDCDRTHYIVCYDFFLFLIIFYKRQALYTNLINQLWAPIKTHVLWTCDVRYWISFIVVCLKVNLNISTKSTILNLFITISQIRLYKKISIIIIFLLRIFQMTFIRYMFIFLYILQLNNRGRCRSVV